jgi:hypothetical protein
MLKVFSEERKGFFFSSLKFAFNQLQEASLFDLIIKVGLAARFITINTGNANPLKNHLLKITWYFVTVQSSSYIYRGIRDSAIPNPR